MTFFQHPGLVLLVRDALKEEFLSSNKLPREYHGQYLFFAGQTLTELNPNILLWDVEKCTVYILKRTKQF